MVPWIVVTDEPEDFADLPVHAIHHTPTGPMAADYLAHLPATGAGRGAAAYHDKRFALLAGLQDFDTAIYVDADSRIAPFLHSAPSRPVSPCSRSWRKASQSIWKRPDPGGGLSS
jgi:hypothetical protein